MLASKGLIIPAPQRIFRGQAALAALISKYLVTLATVSSTVLMLQASYTEASAPLGALTQLEGTRGCVSQGGSWGCLQGKAMGAAYDIAVSPDSKNAYAATHALANFWREPGSGALYQLLGRAGCIWSGQDECAVGRAVRGVESVVISPDGKRVYAVSHDGSIAIFKRDAATGSLINQLPGRRGCINSDGSEGCSTGRALIGATSAAISPNGRNFYAASRGGSVAIFVRNLKTGALTQLPGIKGCVNKDGSENCMKGRALNDASSVSISPDGKNVYVTSSLRSNAIAVFKRDLAAGTLTQLEGGLGCINEDASDGCAMGRALKGAYSASISPDGRNVYVASWADKAVAVFKRDLTVGTLTQLEGEQGCINDDATEKCAQGRGLDYATSITVSGDSQNVYVASNFSDAVAIFKRESSGSLTQLADKYGCISEDEGEGCTKGRALDGAYDVAVSPDDESVYIASTSGAVASFKRQTITSATE